MINAIPEDLVEVGRIGDAYGVQGMIRVVPFSEQETILLDVKQWWLMRTDLRGKTLDAMRDAQLVRSRMQGSAIVAKLKGIDDRDQAQALKGTTVYVSRADFPQTEDDEFYWVDLIGCAVYSNHTSPESLIGVVAEVSDNGAHGVLHVQRQCLNAAGEPENMLTAKGRALMTLIPFVRQTVPVVDLDKRYIQADWPVDF
ncbi:ribosome maturation factor RimM [Pelistega europaea]|uniref:ribosome maturation factor RimM n=1 Tax=Pelistega europaea TaxID=106147 RepID=UPI0031B5B409